MQSYPLHTHNVVYFLFLVGSKRSVYVESYQWQIGLERILILPLAPCGFDTPYLSLPPLRIATMIPCTWGLSRLIQDQTDMHKLSLPWEGPFVVSKNLNNGSYYLIDIRENKDSRTSKEETHRPWNIAHLWPYYT